MKRLLVLFSVVSACGGSSGDDDVLVDAPHDQQLDPNQCAAFAQSAATAATTCGTPLPAGAQASIERWCRKGVTTASTCGGNPAGGLGCFGSPDPSDWVCQLGQPFPSCGGDLESALGAYCLVASGNPACAAIACEFDVDCSGDAGCNSVTKECFQKSAYCIGLPCAFDVDCPSAEKCNSAEHACVGN